MGQIPGYRALRHDARPVVNLIGAIVFSVLGLVYIKNRGKGIAAKFIPTLRRDDKIQ